MRVLVDAEESRMQPAIHHLAVHYMMPRFNLSHPVIYNTVQMYLKVFICQHITAVCGIYVCVVLTGCSTD